MKIIRTNSPFGRGHMYYMDGGSEGLVLVADTYFTPLSVLSECNSWELDEAPFQFPTLTLEFNKGKN